MSNAKYLAPALLLLVAPACDNVGRAFDTNGPGTGTGTATNIQRMVEQGILENGRPKVRDVFPSGSGWPGTVPIVVEFNESLNEASVVPQEGSPTLQIRIAGQAGSDPNTNPIGDPGNNDPGTAPQVLPASYDFLLGGRVVVIRPTQAFDTTQIQEYEIVVTSELRDADGVRFLSSGERVIGKFTPDQDAEIEDGEILTTVPIDNARDALREGPAFLVFTKPVTQSTVTTSTFFLRSGNAVVPGAVSFPVRAGGLGGGNNDGRIVQFTPTANLAASAEVEVVVTAGITVGSGVLEFKNRTPFGKFRTIGPEAPTAVAVGNSPTGTTNKVSQANIATLLIDVDLPTSAAAGDRVDVRIYGLDTKGGTSGAANFVEAGTNVPVAGQQTVTVDFAGKLGTGATPGFLEGDLTLAARVVRGSETTGFALSDSATDPELDVTGPTVAFPTADVDGSVVYYTDQEYLTFHGQASERLGAVTLTLASTPAPAPNPTTGVVFGFGAAGDGGKFMFNPILLGRRTSPVEFTLTIADQAGNLAPAINGTIQQRGVVTGSVAGGTLTVEAYDDATFGPLGGATVLVEPGVPTAAATGRVTGVTDATGRVTFTGLTGASHSVTIVHDGYDLITLIDSAAGFMSLPLRPQTGATATLDGAVAFAATAGTSVLVGTNILDDVRREETQTTASQPLVIPATQVRPNRPFAVSAFSGVFPPTTKPTFTNFACSICGATGLLKEALQPRIAAGARSSQTLALLPTAVTAVNLAATYDKDLSTWTGLNASSLTGPPTVRVMTSLFGLPSMLMTGVGFSTLASGTTYTIDGSYSGALATAVATLGPKFWVSTEATDTSGNIARHRRIVSNLVSGTTIEPFVVTPKIPTITAPGGPSSGSPAVTYQDRLDPTSIPNGFAFQVLTARDASGRQWRLIEQETATADAGVTRQLPSMAGVTKAMLATGTWSIHAESVLVFSLTFAAADYVLEELRREEVSYARAAAVNFTVN